MLYFCLQYFSKFREGHDIYNEKKKKKIKEKKFEKKIWIPNNLTIQIKPGYHALSKALPISRKPPHVSRVESASKHWYILYMISTSWLIQESFGQNLDWCLEKDFALLGN